MRAHAVQLHARFPLSFATAPRPLVLLGGARTVNAIHSTSRFRRDRRAGVAFATVLALTIRATVPSMDDERAPWRQVHSFRQRVARATKLEIGARLSRHWSNARVGGARAETHGLACFTASLG